MASASPRPSFVDEPESPEEVERSGGRKAMGVVASNLIVWSTVLIYIDCYINLVYVCRHVQVIIFTSVCRIRCVCAYYICAYTYIYTHMYQETWTQGCDGWCRQLHNQLAGAMPMPNFTTQWQSNFASPIAALGCLLWMGKTKMHHLKWTEFTEVG